MAIATSFPLLSQGSFLIGLGTSLRQKNGLVSSSNRFMIDTHSSIIVSLKLTKVGLGYYYCYLKDFYVILSVCHIMFVLNFAYTHMVFIS
jgi:hypothetical protein